MASLAILTRIHVPIPQVASPNITPTHIIFRELNFNDKNGFFFSRRDCRLPFHKIPNWSNIEDFVDTIEAHKNRKIRQDRIETKNMSIPIRVPAYVVISLEDDFHWDFDNDYDGITLGSKLPGHDLAYENLRHHNPVNGKLQEKACNHCRVVVFSATPPLPASEAGADNVQAINFNLIDRGGTPTTVDPDIRYPGNGGSIDGGG